MILLFEGILNELKEVIENKDRREENTWV